jgi:hypothetical protein
MIRLATIYRIALVVAAVAVAPACQSRFLDPSDEWTNLHQVAVRPSAVALPIGFTRQMTAFVNGSSNQSVRWSVPVGNSGKVAVSSSGEVRCLAEGSSLVTAQSVADLYASGAAVVFCEMPGRLITVGPKALTFAHAFGSAAYTCPQFVSSVTITNTAVGTVAVSVLLPASIKLSPEAPFTLASGESRDLAISFDCSVLASFVGTLSFVAKADGVSEEKTVTVTAAITR